MHIRVECNAGVVRRWHLTLVRRLKSMPGKSVTVALVEGLPDLPAGLEALFQLEAAIHGLAGHGQAERVPAADLLALSDAGEAPADLVLDLCGSKVPTTVARWQLTYDGFAGEEGLIAAILSGATPTAGLVYGQNVIAEARLGTEYGGIALASFDEMLARSVTLITAAVAGGCQTRLPALRQEEAGAPPAIPSISRLGKAAAKKVARRIVQQIYRLCYNSPHWRVGWRKLNGPDLFDLGAHPKTGWTDLPDDGRRFYADPFPFVHQGKLTLFVEDFIHKLGKGIISAVDFVDGRPAGKPVPVLEHNCHLSYPFIFEEEGQIWMVPETSGNGTIELFRATAYPGGWVKEADLVTGLTCSDATLVRHGNLWWMFATVRDGGGAFSDALHLWSAPDFRGPWTTHAANPVLIDIATARPAGRMVVRDGRLLRPVQDCRRGYGAALAIARVTKLDHEGFAQVVEAMIGPGPEWPGRRLHSLNSAGGFEFIDGSATAPKWKGLFP
ncbi:glucosamine inositolphosphorylceramide transferase family protein [Allorhizobium pseudoryzae]|uniref:glucosamine inositolphosphorylceramide transferase family protein n=1 Tax=Allorhizobium pseudoryzae TaxID=379684 RepID=UPI003D000BD5